MVVRFSIWPILCGSLIALTLSACSGEGAMTSAPTSSSAVSPPNVGEAIAGLNMPEFSSATGPVQAPMVETIAPIPTPMEVFKSLAPSEGLKLTPLFTTPLSDTDARIKRLEDAVQSVRNDFDTIMPTMVRTAAMGNNIENLVGKLNELNGVTDTPPSDQPMVLPPDLPPLNITDGLSPAEDRELLDEDCLLDEFCDSSEEDKTAATAAPTALSRPVTAEKAAAPIPGAVGDIKAIRIGDHPDMTRLVLDMTAKATVTATLQNDGKQLVLDLPQMNWTAKKTADALRGAKLISSYKYENGKLILDLLQPAQIKTQQVLPGENGSGFRYVIDLTAKTP